MHSRPIIARVKWTIPDIAGCFLLWAMLAVLAIGLGVAACVSQEPRYEAPRALNPDAATTAEPARPEPAKPSPEAEYHASVRLIGRSVAALFTLIGVVGVVLSFTRFGAFLGITLAEALTVLGLAALTPAAVLILQVYGIIAAHVAAWGIMLTGAAAGLYWAWCARKAVQALARRFRPGPQARRHGRYA